MDIESWRALPPMPDEPMHGILEKNLRNRAQFSSEERKREMQRVIAAIEFTCVCGNHLILKRLSLESIMTGVFCQKCDEQYYIRWQDGVLKRGPYEHSGVGSADS